MASDRPPEMLICAATEMEMDTFGFSAAGTQRLVTGVGIPPALARTLEAAGRERPARILNIGIAGAYPGSGLSLGGIVMGSSEIYGDVGFELPDEPGFEPVRVAAWAEFYRKPLPLMAFPEYPGLPQRPGCTVNACTGTEATGQLRARLFGAAFESMEGAAVAQAGQMLGIPVCEIRAISNIAARRDMRPENIRLALSRLRDYFERCRETPHA